LVAVRFLEGSWFRDVFANQQLVEYYEIFYSLECALLIHNLREAWFAGKLQKWSDYGSRLAFRGRGRE
jgi:hypothetical protein